MLLLIIIPQTKKENLNNIITTRKEFIAKTNEEIPLLTLYIPLIELKKNIYNIESPLNNIEENVQILKESNIEKKYIILAAHSGNNSNTYFNKLIYLSINDLIYVYYNNKELTYIVDKKYYIIKTGYMNIEEENNRIILITCSRTDNNKQLIVEGKLVNKDVK